MYQSYKVHPEGVSIRTRPAATVETQDEARDKAQAFADANRISYQISLHEEKTSGYYRATLIETVNPK